MSQRQHLAWLGSSDQATIPAGVRSGFTLIELLVVIAIIGLLLAILLPSLKGARESSKNVACKSNMRQILIATIYYAQDNRDEIFPVNADGTAAIPPAGGAWARLPGGRPNTYLPGLMYRYVNTVDQIGECPANMRETSQTDAGHNMFGGYTALDFDYTMVANMQGARLEQKIRAGYINKPETWTNWTLPPTEVPEGMAIKEFPGLPVFVEENTRYWNQTYKDGLWSNADQFEVRHRGRGNIAYLEGYVEEFEPPMGAVDTKEEAGDLCANDVYVRTVGPWIRMSSSSLRPYGWINSPRP